MPARHNKREERRRYIRLNTVFPVELRILSLDGKHFLSDWIQGFTNNISRAGICLSVNNFSAEKAALAKGRQVKLSLTIEIPLSRNKVSAMANVVWVDSVVKEPGRYLIGLAYDSISAADNNRIFRYALGRQLIPRLLLLLILALLLSFSLSGYLNLKLIRANRTMIEQLLGILQRSSVAKQNIKVLIRDKEQLNLKLAEIGIRLSNLQEDASKKNTEETEGLIRGLEKDRSSVQEKLILLQKEENSITEGLLLLDKRRAELERANIDKLYQWLRFRQDPHTGLVTSFDTDKNYAKVTYLYDLSLAGLAYVYFDDLERARKIIYFLDRAKKIKGGFLNAYYVADGLAAEDTVYTGPNIWAGIFVLYYTEKTQDKRYLGLAKEIADWVISLQDKGSGAIRGGSDLQWAATENNLDAYAFLKALYSMTGEEIYNESAAKVFSWLKSNIAEQKTIYIISSKDGYAFARDIHPWSILVLGPEKLEELGVNPDQVIELAERNSFSQAHYTRPEGFQVEVKGFNSLPKTVHNKYNIVSVEHTSRMILAYKMMAYFYHKKDMLAKARSYELKADECVTSLSELIILGPPSSGQVRSCLPYATQAVVDTGHGWMTPEGTYGSSVAATSYAIFAYYGFNPIWLED